MHSDQKGQPFSNRFFPRTGTRDDNKNSKLRIWFQNALFSWLSIHNPTCTTEGHWYGGGLAVERNVQARGGLRPSHCLFGLVAQATGASTVCAQQQEGVSATWVSWDTCHGCGQPVPVSVTNWTQLSNSRQNPGNTVKKATDPKGGPKWGCKLVWKCADKCYTFISQITPQTLKTFCTHTHTHAPTNQHCWWGFGLYHIYMYNIQISIHLCHTCWPCSWCCTPGVPDT